MEHVVIDRYFSFSHTFAAKGPDTSLVNVRYANKHFQPASFAGVASHFGEKYGKSMASLVFSCICLHLTLTLIKYTT